MTIIRPGTPALAAPLALLSVALLALAACGDGGRPAAPAEPAAGPVAPETALGVPAVDPTQDIVANASRAPDLTTFVSALQTAGLAEALRGAGPFTVFAPDNDAFEKIDAATREGLMRPERRDELRDLLTYHVVAGRLTSADLAARARAGGGEVALTTVQGARLTAREAGAGRWVLSDAQGGAAAVMEADQLQSNGVIHRIDTVLWPRRRPS